MYTINTEIFSDINTELQAYVLAWFWSRGSGHIQVHKKDADILYTIRNLIDYTGPIGIYNNVADLNISNRDFLNCLQVAGCVNNCRCTQIFPIISETQFPHFIRGIFDSYGRIIISKNKYLNVSITYDESFIQSLRDYLLHNLNIKTKHYYRYSHTNTIQMMITATPCAKKFLNWLYLDANYYLERKFQKWQEYLQKGV